MCNEVNANSCHFVLQFHHFASITIIAATKTQKNSAQPEFLVCNRGVIINMSKVLRFEGDCIEMLDGTHLPVRQKDKNSLLAQFTQYQFRGMQREF